MSVSAIAANEPRHESLDHMQMNTDGSFIMADSNSFLSPYVILSIAPENKCFRKFSFFMKLYVVCTH